MEKGFVLGPACFRPQLLEVIGICFCDGFRLFACRV